MNNFLRMCLNIITQIGPYLVVLLLLKYLVNLQQKRAKEREEEQKKGIIRTHYIIKTEKVLTMFLICTPNTGYPVLGVFLCDTVMNTRRCASNYIDKENGSRHQKE